MHELGGKMPPKLKIDMIRQKERENPPPTLKNREAVTTARFCVERGFFGLRATRINILITSACDSIH